MIDNQTDDLEDQVISDPESSDDSSSDTYQDQHSSVDVQDFLTSKDGTEIWQKTPFIYGSQAQSANVLTEAQGPSRQARNTCGQTPLHSFKLFITDEITQIILKHSNDEGKRLYCDAWNCISSEELHVFLGLMLLAGVYRSKNSPIDELWSEADGRPIFGRSMSRNRFKIIKQCLRFDNRLERDQTDKFAPIRRIFDIFIQKCKANYKPSAFVTIDEQLVTFRGRCSFKMFIPSKPGKYGLKVWALCDSTNSYLCYAQPYVGRVGARDVGQSGRVVLELTEHLSGTGRHITADNFFTDLVTARSLLGRRLTYTGTKFSYLITGFH